MALELIHPSNASRSIQHEYRHDHESFLWTLLWIFATFKDGREVPELPLPFEKWITEDTHIARYAALGDLRIIDVPETTLQKYWPCLTNMLRDLHLRLFDLHKALTPKRREFLRSEQFQKDLYEKTLSHAQVQRLPSDNNDIDDKEDGEDDGARGEDGDEEVDGKDSGDHGADNLAQAAADELPA
jgi:hypothetical protein